jgi:hypothetical protein
MLVIVKIVVCRRLPMLCYADSRHVAVFSFLGYRTNDWNFLLIGVSFPFETSRLYRQVHVISLCLAKSAIAKAEVVACGGELARVL